MKAPLRILHLEDDPKDVELIRCMLKDNGIVCDTVSVKSRAAFMAALEGGNIDLVLSDFCLPDFDGLSAMEIVHARWPAIPVILVSGTVGEEVAIDSLKSGATDYVLKERLGRLAPAVRRAMHEVAERAERQCAEEMIQSERKFSEVCLDSLPGIFYLYDREGNFLRWNKNFERVSGYGPEEIARLKPLDCFTGEERNFIGKKIEEVFEDGAASAEAHFTAKDGTRTPYYFNGQKIMMAGKPCLIGTGIDISQRKKLEAQFVEAQKMEVVGRLASGVTHDFNNILGVIMGYSDLMLQELGPDHALRKHVGEIRHASERAASLTRQLLVFSRKQTVEPVVLDLNEVLKDLDQMLRRLIDENIEMTITPGKQIGPVKTDAGYVGQVLMNLVVNARDAMPNGGKILITTRDVTIEEKEAAAQAGVVAGKYVMFSVSDTGTGMSEEVQARLFEAFFTTKPKGKGTGLGLATCRTIVKQSGGHINVESSLGIGTTFKIYFPRVDEPIAADVKFIKKGPLARGMETLLLVEDESSLRHLARNVLTAQGYEVLTATNGQDGLQVASGHAGAPIRLVITDVIMPQMGGKMMAEWIAITYPGIKILFTSGYTDDAIAHHGVLDAGVEFLAKPYTPAALARKVREMLDDEMPRSGVGNKAGQSMMPRPAIA